MMLTTSPEIRACATAAGAGRAARCGSPSPWRRAATAISPISTISPRLSTTQTENPAVDTARWWRRSEEHTSELQSRLHLVCRLLLEKKRLLRQAKPAHRSRLHLDGHQLR